MPVKKAKKTVKKAATKKTAKKKKQFGKLFRLYQLINW